MTAKTNTAARPARGEPDRGRLPAPVPAPPLTTEERLQQIEAMAKRIDGYVQFIRTVGSLGGTSGEAKERAVAAFYERMTVLERQLGRVQDDLKLG